MRCKLKFQAKLQPFRRLALSIDSNPCELLNLSGNFVRCLECADFVRVLTGEAAVHFVNIPRSTAAN